MHVEVYTFYLNNQTTTTPIFLGMHLSESPQMKKMKHEMKQKRPDLFVNLSIDEFILTITRDLYEADSE